MAAIAAGPRFTAYEDEPVFPGFERVARASGLVTEHVLDEDLEVPPSLSALLDDNGGEM